ncbi:MAG: ribbon-helix-helix protein, CopG family [Euryarchaeota archaeon]|nr:ribbon-helix-helix protein, CopG family [Euryarchaeota archaeon]
MKMTLKNTAMRMDEDVLFELDRIAVEMGTSRSELIRTYVIEGVVAHREREEARMRDRKAREYLAKFLVEKGLAKPHQVANDSFFFGAAPALWLQRVERRLGAEVADELSEKIVEIMGRSDELAAYLADVSE